MKYTKLLLALALGCAGHLVGHRASGQGVTNPGGLPVGADSLKPADSFPTLGSFTYQGRLKVGGGSPDPSQPFDFRFRLFGAHSGGSPLDESGVPGVTVDGDGLFTVVVDAHPTWDTVSETRWIEIDVRASNPTLPYTTLSPRQRLTPAPAALFADLAGKVRENAITSSMIVTDTVATVHLQSGAVTGAKIAAGNVVRSLNGLKDQVQFMTQPGLGLTTISNELSLSLNLVPGEGIALTPLGDELQIALAPASDCKTNCYWLLRGNPSTDPVLNFLGTTDNQALAIKVNNNRALFITPAATPNLIGGHLQNTVLSAVVGATIGGGGEPANFNAIGESFGVIGGGSGNTIHPKAIYSVVGGGLKNVVWTNSAYAVIDGGDNNQIRTNAPYATLGGGQRNTVEPLARHATLAGGVGNLIGTNALYATIGGGTNNVTSLNCYGASILGGNGNLIQQFSPHTTIGGGLRNAIETGTESATIAGGGSNTVRGNADFASMGGGATNWIHSSAPFATIPGGQAAAATNYGQFAYASGQFGRNGDAQMSLYVLRRSMPTATTTELFLDGDTATRRMVIANNTTWTFDMLIAGRSTVAGAASAGYRIAGVIRNNGGAVAFVGAPTVLATDTWENIGVWDAFVEADNVNDALVIKATADQATRWVATVRTAEVTW